MYLTKAPNEVHGSSQEDNVLFLPGIARGDSRERDMERINQYGYYDLGKTLNQLTAFGSEDIARTSIVWPLLEGRQALRRLIGGTVPLGLCRASAERLHDRMQELLDEYCSAKGDDGNLKFSFPDPSAPPVPAWRWEYVKSALTTFETIFSEEMREATAYFVPKRGIYSTPDLVDEADKTFPAEIVAFIPEKSRIEWKAAGRCLAFNLLTASGFHVARAVEGTMETYHQLYCGIGGKSLKTWGDYIEALEKVDQGAKLVPTPKTLAELRQMKDDYRNPIMHPRVVLTEPDARMLYSNGESLIIAMAQEIAKITKSAQLALVPPGSAAAELFGVNTDGEGQKSIQAG